MTSEVLSSPDQLASYPTRPLGQKTQRALNALFSCCLLESLAFGLILPVQSLFLITDLALSSRQVGITLAVYYLAHMIGAFVSGRISDSTGRRPILIFAFGWHGLAYLFVAVLAIAPTMGMLESLKMGLVITQQFFSGISGGSSLPAQTYVMDLCSARTRAGPLSQIGAIYGGTIAVGALLGGFLVRTVGATRFAIFILGAGLCIVASAIAFVLLPESLPVSTRRLPSLSVAGISSDDFEINLGMVAIWLAKFGLSWAIYGIVTIYPFFVKANFGADDLDFKLGLFMFVGATAQMATLLIGFTSISRILGKHLTLIAASAVAGTLLIVLPVYTKYTSGDNSIYYHVLWKVVFQSVVCIAESALPDALGLYVGERHLGLALGVLGVSKSTAAVFGTLIAGILYGNSSNPDVGFLLMCGCCLMASAGGVAAKILAKQARDAIGKMKRLDEDVDSERLIESVDTETTRL